MCIYRQYTVAAWLGSHRWSGIQHIRWRPRRMIPRPVRSISAMLANNQSQFIGLLNQGILSSIDALILSFPFDLLVVMFGNFSIYAMQDLLQQSNNWEAFIMSLRRFKSRLVVLSSLPSAKYSEHAVAGRLARSQKGVDNGIRRFGDIY